jgi:hypothetical protein
MVGMLLGIARGRRAEAVWRAAPAVERPRPTRLRGEASPRPAADGSWAPVAERFAPGPSSGTRRRVRSQGHEGVP